MSSQCPQYLFHKNNICFSVRLIHRSSPKSPFYNLNATQEDLIKSDVRNSYDRYFYVSRLFSSDPSMKYVSAPISNNFIMHYKIGSPPVDAVGILDTGSSMIWLQCHPRLQCYRQSAKIFDPKRSTSFKQLLCGSPECFEVWNSQCINGYCHYQINYMDTLYTKGVLALDTLQMDNMLLSNTLFGCGYNNSLYAPFMISGVIGIGNSSASLVNQIRTPQFSYLLSTINEDGIHG